MGGEGESYNQTQGGGGDVTNFRLGDVARRGSSPAERGNHVTRHKEARSFVGPAPAAKGTPRARGMIGQTHVIWLHSDKSFVTLLRGPFRNGKLASDGFRSHGLCNNRNRFVAGHSSAESISGPIFCGGIDFRSPFENIQLV